MKYLVVPGLPAAALCLAVDTRIASAPPAVLAAINTFPFIVATLVILCLLMRLSRR